MLIHTLTFNSAMKASVELKKEYMFVLFEDVTVEASLAMLPISG